MPHSIQMPSHYNNWSCRALSNQLMLVKCMTQTLSYPNNCQHSACMHPAKQECDTEAMSCTHRLQVCYLQWSCLDRQHPALSDLQPQTAAAAAAGDFAAHPALAVGALDTLLQRMPGLKGPAGFQQRQQKRSQVSAVCRVLWLWLWLCACINMLHLGSVCANRCFCQKRYCVPAHWMQPACMKQLHALM